MRNLRLFFPCDYPSLQLLKSRFPAVSIGETNLHDNDNTLRLGQSECALIARLQLQVEVRSVTAGVYEFLSALSEGRTVGEAIGRGTANAPDFDLIECFNALISADVVVGLQLSQ